MADDRIWIECGVTIVSLCHLALWLRVFWGMLWSCVSNTQRALGHGIPMSYGLHHTHLVLPAVQLKRQTARLLLLEHLFRR